MSSNNRTSTPKRLRSSDDGISEDQQGKKQRLESILGSMTRSVNVTWSGKEEFIYFIQLRIKIFSNKLLGSTTTKRARSKSSEPAERNVRSRMTAEVTSTNPEPTSFLMAGLARELDIIDQGLSSGATCSTVGKNISRKFIHQLYKNDLRFLYNIN